jgi:hypothetical protein
VERRGLTERKRFQQKISRDSAHGIFSFRFGNVGEVAKQYKFIQRFLPRLDVIAVCVSSARTGYRVPGTAYRPVPEACLC